MKKIVSLSLVFLLLLSVILAPNVFAKEISSNKLLVALGDSITFGYNLENNLSHVSKEAYPKLIGEKFDYRVRNLAVSGWTSEDLLNALKYDDKYRDATRHADLLTLNIGGNDVLGYLTTLDSLNPQMDIDELMSMIGTYYINLGNIFQEIRTLNPEAPILFYGFYNPIDEESPLFNGEFTYDDFTELIGSVNYSLLDGYADYFGNIYYVDALAAFELYGIYEGEKTDLFVDLVHPSELGQEILFEATIPVYNLIP